MRAWRNVKHLINPMEEIDSKAGAFPALIAVNPDQKVK
jgi:hypothetical protein